MATFNSNIDRALALYWRGWSLPFAPSALECAIHNGTPYVDRFNSYDPSKGVLVSACTPYISAITADYKKKLFNLYCGLAPVAPDHRKGCGIINFSKFINSDYDFRLF